MFSEAYMQRALAVALCLSPICALLGVFVTARRMAFFSDTIAHGALAGIALGFWLGFAEPTLPLMFFSLLVAVLLLWLKENTELLTDTIMALLLSGSVAVGVIILSLLKGYRGELHRYLFGDVLAVSPLEVWLSAALLVVASVFVFGKLSPLVLLTAHEEVAHVCGIRIRRLNYLFVIGLTVVVTMSIRLLGIILVTSLLVIPPAAARNLSANLRQHIILSVVFGFLGGLAGVIASYQFNVPCGPAIVLAAIALFLVSLLFRQRRAAPAPETMRAPSG